MSIRTSSVFALCFLVSGAAIAQPAPPPAIPAQPAAKPAQPAAKPAAGPAQPAPAAGVAPAAAGTEPTVDLREAPENKLGSGRDALRVQAGGLTSEQVARRAVATSVTVESKQAEIEAAAAKVDQAIAQFLPRLSLSATYRKTMKVVNNLGTSGGLVGAGATGLLGLGTNCPQLDPAVPPPAQCVVDSSGNAVMAVDFNFPVITNYYSLEASLSVPLSDYALRFSNAVKGARFSVDAAKTSKRAEELKNANDAKISYYNWTRSVAAGAVTESSLERTRALLEDARGAFSVGMVTKADVMRLEALVASTEFAITQAKTMRSLAEEQLAISMGEPAREYQIGEDVLAPVPPPPSGDRNALVEEAYRNRLELKSVQENVRALERGVKALNIGRYPRLDAFGNATYANPNQLYFPATQKWNPSWAVGVTLSYSPNDIATTNGSSRELKAQLAQLRAGEKQLRLGLRMEVASAELDYRKALANIETTNRGYEAAREAYRVARDLYQVGRATTTDLINAESELVMAELNQINAAIDARVAAIKLEHATGRDAVR